MVKKRSEWPVRDEYVICKVNKIFPQGAFLTLEDYNKEGMLHISQLSSKWVKNVRDHIKEGERLVLKVWNLDTEKGHIDLSLKFVSKERAVAKMQEAKRANRAEKLLEIAANKVGKSVDQAYKEAGFALEDKFGEVFMGFETAAKKGEEVLKEAGVPSDWVQALYETAKENIKIPIVQVTGYVDLKTPAPDGVEVIRKSLNCALGLAKESGVTSTIQYISSPRYMIFIKAPDYKKAETALKNIADSAISAMEKSGGEGKFYRELKEGEA